MALTEYGGSPADVIGTVATDPDSSTGYVFTPTSGTFTAWTASTGGTQITDLFKGDGTTAQTTVTPDPVTYRIHFFANNYSGSLWLENGGQRWRFDPVGAAVQDLSGYATVTQLSTKADTSAIPTWTTISGKPAVIGAGADQAAARAAIGAASTADIATSSSLDGLTDVTTGSAQQGVDNVIYGNGDGTFSVQPASTDLSLKITNVFSAGADVSSVPAGSLYAMRQAASATFAPTYLGGAGAGSSTSPPNTVPYTLTQAVPTGSMLWVFAVASAESALDAGFSVVDSKANSWAQQAFVRTQSTSQVAALRAHITTALASGDTVTLNTSITRNRLAFIVVVVTGALTSAATDTTATGTNGSNLSVTSLSVTSSAATAQADELAFGFFGFSSSGTTFGSAADWTQLGSTQLSGSGTGDRGIAVQYKRLTTVQGANGVQSSGTLTTPSAYAGGLVFVKKAP